MVERTQHTADEGRAVQNQHRRLARGCISQEKIRFSVRVKVERADQRPAGWKRPTEALPIKVVLLRNQTAVCRVPGLKSTKSGRPSLLKSIAAITVQPDGSMGPNELLTNVALLRNQTAVCRALGLKSTKSGCCRDSHRPRPPQSSPPARSVQICHPQKHIVVQVPYCRHSCAGIEEHVVSKTIAIEVSHRNGRGVGVGVGNSVGDGYGSDI